MVEDLATGLFLFLVLLIYNWLNIVLYLDGTAMNLVLPNVNIVFYHDYVLILIFVDIFLVLYSMKENPGFALVFRNIGFVVSTIIMRMYFVAPRPYNLLVVIGGVLFGTITFAISVAYARLEQKGLIAIDEPA